VDLDTSEYTQRQILYRFPRNALLGRRITQSMALMPGRLL
jgi:hypothetical protein